MTELSQSAREKRRAYNRAWAARNRDRVREYNRAYWERKAAESREKELEEKTIEEEKRHE